MTTKTHTDGQAALDQLRDWTARSRFWYFKAAYAAIEAPDSQRVVWKHYPPNRPVAPIHFCQSVGYAIRDAQEEMERPAKKEERKSIDRVAALAKALRAELLKPTCPLPKNWRTLCELDNGSPLEFAWQACPGVDSLAPVVSLTEVLGIAIELAERHAKRLRPRAVQRIRSGTDASALAARRCLAVHLHTRLKFDYGRAPPTVVAALSNGVFTDLPGDPLAATDIKPLLAVADASYAAVRTKQTG